MNEAERDKLESDIRAHHDGQELSDAARVALEGYGPEILGFLMALCREQEVAAEVFSQFSEDMWRGLPAFQWNSSFRTWAYTIARNAYRRFLRDPHRRRATRLETSDLFKIQQKVRTQSMPFLLTAVKDRFAALRESLSGDDQTLLILRLDRRMNWLDIAEVMLERAEEGEEPVEYSRKDLKKKAASLRKRYERLKSKLRELAEKDGLMDDHGVS